MGEELHPGYGGFYHRFRRDFILLLLSIKAWSPLDIARYAFQQTAFYRRHYGALPDDFAALPLVTHELITECDPYDLLAEDMADWVVAYAQTGGLRGAPVPSFLTESALHGARSSAKISPYISDLDYALAGNRAVVIGLPLGFTPHVRWFDEMLRNHGAVVAHIDPRSPAACARTIARLRPSVVVGTANDFLAWMWLLRMQHPHDFEQVRGHLKGFLAHGEVVGRARQQVLAREFGVTVVDVYAAGEGFSAVPCPCGEMHLLPVYVAELVDEQGRVIGDTGEGRLVFTNLLRRSTPMVRYLLDDFVTIAHSNCPHGFKKSIVPHGRFDETLQLGPRRIGPRHVADILYAHGMFGDFRVVAHADHFGITAEIWGQHPDVGTLRTAFQQGFGVDCRVELVPFGTLTPVSASPGASTPIRVIDRRPGAGTDTPPAYTTTPSSSSRDAQS